MEHTHVKTGNIVIDLLVIGASWTFPKLLVIGVQDVQHIADGMADVLVHIGQIVTTALVVATAAVRYRKSRKDKNKE